MADPTFPAAIDFLVSGPASVLKAVTPTVVISDGIPVEKSDDEVAIGVTPGDSETRGGQSLATFGPLIDEEYEIPVGFSCWRGGASQKAARDAVFALFNAWFTWLRSNNTLGGILTFPVELRNVVYIATTEQDADRGEGRRATVILSVRCHSRI